MADQTTPPPATGLVISPDTELRFGALVALIQGSESMNSEERQYWINILPIMTQEQLKNLEEILTSEKKQLAAIDEKYAKQPDGAAGASVEAIGEKIRTRKQKREEVEREDAAMEAKAEDALLSEIQSL